MPSGSDPPVFLAGQEHRLRQRKTETEESLAKRLAAAQADMESSECLARVSHSPIATDSPTRGRRAGAVTHSPPLLTEPPLALSPFSRQGAWPV